MPRDPEKARARSRRYRERKKIAKYGPEAAGKDMRGRHGNCSGPKNARWNGGRIITSQGYVAVRVAHEHPHAWGPPGSRHKYAYEHIIVAVGYLGRPLAEDELVHHRSGDKTDNRWENLEILSRSEHAKCHDKQRSRDDLGRFKPGAGLRVQQMPGGAA